MSTTPPIAVLGPQRHRPTVGRVLEARDPELRRRVAVKVVIDPHSVTDVQLARFLAEAQVTAQLEHPNIVPVHDVGVSAEGRIFFVMKKVEGRTLETILNLLAAEHEATMAEWSQHRLLSLFVQVCNAVAYAHERGVLHRDIKPANIMIGAFGEVLLLDWGIALTLPEGGEWPVPGGDEKLDIIGTPAYMAPEMVSGGPITTRTDVYLAGALLHEVLTARPPHSGQVFLELLESILSDPPVKREYPGGTPAELRAICERALSPRPVDRYRSVQGLREAISRFLTHRQSTILNILESALEVWVIISIGIT